MQLDTRLPLLAAQQPVLQFQPETRLESLGKIAPAINAMRQLQAQQIDMETELRKRQAFDQFRAAAQQAGLSGDLGQLAQVLFTHGQTAEHFKIGADLMRASQEEARNRRLFGSGEGGEPTGTMPAATLAAAAPATIQAQASEVAPEMAFYGAGGGKPANAMMAMEAPAPMPAQPSAPRGYSFAGRTYSAPVVQEMLAGDKTRPLALEIIKANEPKQDEIANRMLKMGLDPSKQSDWVRYHEISRAPESSPEIVKLQAQVEALPANDPRRRALQDRINILTTRPEQKIEIYAPVPMVDPKDPSRIIYGTREQAIGQQPPNQVEGLTAQEKQKREAKFPQATAALRSFESTSNTLIKDLETLANHPGLGSITGIVAGRVPAVTSAGREAEALYDKIRARGGFQELQAMRAASPTGGALGNVSNQEGARLESAFAALDRRQDAASVRKAIKDAISQIRSSQQILKDTYESTYEYRQPAAAPVSAPAPATGGWTIVR